MPLNAMKNLAQKIAHTARRTQSCLQFKRASGKRSSCSCLLLRPHTEASCFTRTTNFDKFCYKFSPSNILSNVLRERSNEGITHLLCFYGFSFLSKSIKQNTYTVFTRTNAAAFITFFAPQVRRLFEGGVYSRAAFIANH